MIDTTSSLSSSNPKAGAPLGQAGLPESSRAIHTETNGGLRLDGGFLKDLLIILSLIIAYVVVFAMARPGETDANQSTILWLGVILGISSTYGFLASGSHFILLTSVLSYGHLIFVASPAVLLGLGELELRSDLRPSSVLAFLTFFFIVQISLVIFSRPSSGHAKITVPEFDGSLQLLSIFLVLMGVMATNLSAEWSVFGPFANLTLAAIILSSFVMFTRPTVSKALGHAVITFGFVMIYVSLQFGGFGRLVLASFLLSIVVVFSWVVPTYLAKIATLFATIPGLIFLASRDLFGERTGDFDTVRGLASAFGPFQSGAFILQSNLDGSIKPTGGESHLTSLLFWVPRQVWPDKPEGFGRAIAAITQTQTYDTSPGHSDSAPYIAEWIWDFGMPGLLIMPVLIFLVVRVDRRILAYLSSRNQKSTIVLVSQVIGVSMALNYVWGGTFTYAARTIMVIGVLMGLQWTYISVVRKRRGGELGPTLSSLPPFSANRPTGENWNPPVRNGPA